MGKNPKKWGILEKISIYLRSKSIRVMFVGDYLGKIDAKSRLIIPSQFRKNCEGEDTFVVKRNIYDKALDVFPAKTWGEEVARFRERLNAYNPKHSALLREFYRGTAELTLDGAGRILMPKRLLESVGISKSVVVVGVGEKMVIWDEETYENSAMSQDDFEKLVMEELG